MSNAQSFSLTHSLTHSRFFLYCVIDFLFTKNYVLLFFLHEAISHIVILNTFAVIWDLALSTALYRA